MKRFTTSERLRQLINQRGIKQVDILEMSKPYCNKYNIKLHKNDLSQYVNGKVTPKQDKLFILACTLDVSEAWLLGYDVPMERIYNSENRVNGGEFTLTPHERKVIIAYRSHVLEQATIDKILDVEPEVEEIKKQA